MMIIQNVKLLAVKMILAVGMFRTKILKRWVMHAAMFLTASQHQLRLPLENRKSVAMSELQIGDTVKSGE